MSAVLQVCTAQVYLGGELDAGAAVRQALSRAPQVLIAALLRFLAMAVAFLVLFLPVLYVVALLFAVTPIIILEQGSVWGAMRRSAALSRGRKWHILNTLGLVAIIYYMLVIGFSVVGTIAGNFVVATIVSAVVTVVVYPVVAIAETLLYYDARIQSEGLDIELMTGALDVPPASPA
jgi:membrane-anchored glycerophosphoryl diester phosphodiesterase (GDPDase)